jgi:putative tricarboxylic transport membrane protein
LSTPLSEIAPLARSGEVRLLSISSPERLGGEFAAVPTWRSMGIDVTVLHWRGLFAPPGMPAQPLKFWEDGVARLTRTDAWKKALEKYGWYDAYAPSAAFRRDMDQEIARYTRIMKELGLLKDTR